MIALLLNKFSFLLRMGVLILAPVFLVTPESLQDSASQEKADSCYELSLSENSKKRKAKKVITQYRLQNYEAFYLIKDQSFSPRTPTQPISRCLYLQQQRLQI